MKGHLLALCIVALVGGSAGLLRGGELPEEDLYMRSWTPEEADYVNSVVDSLMKQNSPQAFLEVDEVSINPAIVDTARELNLDPAKVNDYISSFIQESGLEAGGEEAGASKGADKKPVVDPSDAPGVKLNEYMSSGQFQSVHGALVSSVLTTILKDIK